LARLFPYRNCTPFLFSFRPLGRKKTIKGLSRAPQSRSLNLTGTVHLFCFLFVLWDGRKLSKVFQELLKVALSTLQELSLLQRLYRLSLFFKKNSRQPLEAVLNTASTFSVFFSHSLPAGRQAQENYQRFFSTSYRRASTLHSQTTLQKLFQCYALQPRLGNIKFCCATLLYFTRPTSLIRTCLLVGEVYANPVGNHEHVRIK